MRAQVKAVSKPSDLRSLNVGDFAPEALTAEEFSHLAKVTESLWLHSGDLKDPHAVLTSGKCSDGFCDTLRVLRYTKICELAAMALVEVVDAVPAYQSLDFDWVIGSDHAGAVFSQNVAMQWGLQHDFTSKGPNKSQDWSRFQISPDEVVLQVEELITTLGTLQAVREGIRGAHAYPIQFAPFAATLVHRSSIYDFEGAPILYLAHYDIEVWDPADCPLCAAGSERIQNPKQNWGKLTGNKA